MRGTGILYASFQKPYLFFTRSSILVPPILMENVPPPIAFFQHIPIFDNPFAAMGYMLVHGGWFIVGVAFLLGLWKLWCFEIEEHYWHTKMKWMLLAINVPKQTEQTVKAVENIFASLMGLHITVNAWEKYVEGRHQENFACEIASHGGLIQFYMWVPVKTRDVFEAAIFAQYPDAEIHPVDDYAKRYPSTFPDETWDAWGTELVVKKSECIPIKTYPQFEDKLSGTFKDPLSQLFEVMGSLQPGEELWVQYPIKPVDQGPWQEKCQKLALKMIGVEDVDAPLGGGHAKKGSGIFGKIFGSVGEFGYHVFHSAITGGPPTDLKAEKKPTQNQPRSQLLYMSPRETEVIKAIELKSGKLGYLSKIRIIYIAHKDLFSKNRKKVITGIMGVFRQFNAHDMNTFGLGKHTFVRAYYYFIQYRLNRRKRILMRGYKIRSSMRGDKNSILSVEELATLWHFPSLEISAPLLQKAQVKRGEPPSGLPLPGFIPHIQPPLPSDEHGGGGGGQSTPDTHAPQGSTPTNLPFA